MRLEPNVANVLAFETAWSSHRRGKDVAIRRAFGFSAAVYAARLAAALEHPSAPRIAPSLVFRLLRLRDQRRAVRVARRVDPWRRAS